MSSPRDRSSLLWGLVLALAAGMLAWAATGHHFDRALLLRTAPFVLILLGVLAYLAGPRRG